MRITVLCGACAALVGCVNSDALAAPELAPMPRAIPDNPRWRARQESFRNGKDLVLRGLARGEIKAGDPIEPLIKLHADYTVLKHGEFVILTLDNGYGDTRLVAKGGKLVLARTSSCIYRDEFFRDMTGKEWEDSFNAYNAALQEQNARRAAAMDGTIPPPREVTKPVP